MNNDHAKQLLIDYRRDRTPTSEQREALALTARDPDLNAWFTAQQHFHETVRHTFRTIEVPADLKTRILNQRKIVPLWRKQLPIYAAAAALMALIAVSAIWHQSDREQIIVAGFQNRMVGFALREYRMDLLSENPEEIRDFLAKQGAPADYSLPQPLEALQPMGGARLSWQGNPVSMICYQLETDKIAYIFVMDEKALPGQNAVHAAPEFIATKGLTTARWKSDAKVYFVAAPVTENKLRELVQNSEL